MGAAIEVFAGATAIAVGRDRFLPVKTTNELLLLRSDVFALGEDGRLQAQVARIPEIDLDPKHYKLIEDFDRLVTVAPSLRNAESLVVRGEWSFDAPSAVAGDVRLDDAGQPRPYR
jgi:UTP--glucose-1-phosphate uridylyltransferase